jgi:hypothetical protein
MECVGAQSVLHNVLRNGDFTRFVQNIIGDTEKDNLINILKSNYFFLIADESTDKSTIKHMALVARIVDNYFNASDYFLALLPVKEGNEEQLYNIILNLWKKKSNQL